MPQAIISAQKVTQNIQINQQNLTILKEIDLEIYAGEQLPLQVVLAQENRLYSGF